jgi:hypothetical protein
VVEGVEGLKNEDGPADYDYIIWTRIEVVRRTLKMIVGNERR